MVINDFYKELDTMINLTYNKVILNDDTFSLKSKNNMLEKIKNTGEDNDYI